jgi:hypothetical protein
MPLPLKLTIKTLTPQAIFLIDQLVEAGIYGNSREEVIVRIIDNALIAKISEGLIQPPSGPMEFA